MIRSGNQEQFSQRLRDLMRQAGHVSATARSGVNVADLAKAAGISYEMARRYVEGKAYPRPATLVAIANWLGVNPGALSWGDNAPQGNGIDSGVLQQCLNAVMGAQGRAKTPITSEKAARLVAILYEEAKRGTMPADSTIDLLIRAA